MRPQGILTRNAECNREEATVTHMDVGNPDKKFDKRFCDTRNETPKKP